MEGYTSSMSVRAFQDQIDIGSRSWGNMVAPSTRLEAKVGKQWSKEVPDAGVQAPLCPIRTPSNAFGTSRPQAQFSFFNLPSCIQHSTSCQLNKGFPSHHWTRPAYYSLFVLRHLLFPDWTGSGVSATQQTGTPCGVTASEGQSDKLLRVGFIPLENLVEKISRRIWHLWLDDLFKKLAPVKGGWAQLLSVLAFTEDVLHPCRIEQTPFRTRKSFA